MNKSFAVVGIAFLTIVLLGSCSSKSPEQSNINPDITAKELAQHIKILSANAFGGRKPGTPGSTKAVNYIAKSFKEAGLAPAVNGSWFQKVPLVSIALKPKTPVTFKGPDEPVILYNGGDIVEWTTRVRDSVSLQNSNLVFVGYGIVAPQYHWNDYKGLDVKGKTVVILVNDPGYATHDSQLFKGKTETYYGRWTYKYEEAARQGASAAIVIHETGPAGYPWGVVSGSFTGPQDHMVSSGNHPYRLRVEAWITHQFANKLFQNVGMTYKKAKEAALKESFKPIPLDVTMSSVLHNTIKKAESKNVVGVLKGNKEPEETVVYTAHWDHLGTDTTLDGDQIYNGAIDNASGISALIGIAEKFAGLSKGPQRSVLFIATTAEEAGLLGSKYYTAHPLYPFPKTVGVINMDSAFLPGCKAKDIRVVGYGLNNLQQYLERVAVKHGRVVKPELFPQKGYYFRGDNFSFARKGVPAMRVRAGINCAKGGVKKGRKLKNNYIKNRYHKPSDEYNPDWDLSGMEQDVKLLYQLGYTLAGSNEWPKWDKDASFRSIRLKTAGIRK